MIEKVHKAICNGYPCRVKLREDDGTIRIHVAFQQGNAMYGVEIPLEDTNPIAIKELLESPNVEMDEEDRETLQELVRGWA